MQTNNKIRCAGFCLAKVKAAALCCVFGALLALPGLCRADVTMETGNDGGKSLGTGERNQGVFDARPDDNDASVMQTPPRPENSDDAIPPAGPVIVVPEVHVGPPYPPLYPPPHPPRPHKGRHAGP